MLLGLVLGQKIPETLYPGYEKYGHEALPGEVGKVRLGLTSAVRERLVQKILCMDGQPAEYLKRVDEIMNILVNEIDKRSRHPDEIVRGLINNLCTCLKWDPSRPTFFVRRRPAGEERSRKLNRSETLPKRETVHATVGFTTASVAPMAAPKSAASFTLRLLAGQ
jgi:hypothetical protein